MDRKEFLKIACGMGLCSCVGSTLFAQEKAVSQSKPKTKEEEEIAGLKWKIDDIQKKYTALIEIISNRVDAKTRDLILEDMGRKCAAKNEAYFKKFKGDLAGFLEDSKQRGGIKVEFDDKNKSFTIIGPPSTRCACSAVQEKLMPRAYCACSLGWQKEVYSTILDKPVDAVLVDSILCGGKKCAFKITVLDTKDTASSDPDTSHFQASAGQLKPRRFDYLR